MQVMNIMSTDVVTVNMDSPVSELKDKFDNFNIHHLIVCNSNRVTGVISDRDVLKTISPYIGTAAEQNRDLFTLQKRAHQIMSRKLITIAPEELAQEGARLLLKHNISCLPVIDKNEILQGIITWKDLLKYWINTDE